MRRRRGQLDAAKRLRLIHDTVDIQRERISAKISTIHSRASFIIAADAVVVGIRSTAIESWDSWARWFPLALVLLSAVFAVAVLVGSQVEEVAPEKLRLSTSGKSPDVAEYDVYRAKLRSLETSRQDLRWRERTLRVGTILLLGGLVVVVAQVIGTTDPFHLRLPLPSSSTTSGATMES